MDGPQLNQWLDLGKVPNDFKIRMTFEPYLRNTLFVFLSNIYFGGALQF